MGIYSDYFEKLREYSQFDPAMIYAQENIDVSHYRHIKVYDPIPTYRRTDLFAGINKQYKLLNEEKIEKAKSAARRLIDLCILREKQLLNLLRSCDFKTNIVKSIIKEYTDMVNESMQYAIEYINNSKYNTVKMLNSIYFDEDYESLDAVICKLIAAVFSFLYLAKELDDSRFLQELFNDIVILINQLVGYETEYVKPKDICREYYENIINPECEYGIETCENCDEKLYKGFPYCFNCFVRSDIDDK